MRKYLLAALLAGTFATPAMAQDTAPFSGVRVEGIVGYDTTDVEGEGSDGVTYGAQVGYDLQSGGALVGIEAEAWRYFGRDASSLSWAESTTLVLLPYNPALGQL